jgi:CBS domain-containing protein
MALVIYDQGYRIQTPVESLFRPRGVDGLTQSVSNSALPASDDQLHQQQALEQRIQLSRERFQVPGEADSGGKSLLHKAYQDTRITSENPNNPQALRAAQIMTSPVLTIPPETSLRQAWSMMHDQEVSHLVVVDSQERALGIISSHDIMLQGVDSPISVTQSYHRQMIVATPDTEVSSIAASFVRYPIGAIPVIGPDDRLEGIVCRTDLIRLLINDGHVESWA